MTIRVGINGFGRIGRNFFRAAKQQGADIDFVAANDLGSLETMAHLLQYDSVHGPPGTQTSRSSTTASRSTATSSRSSPSATRQTLPWGDLGVDVVIESTGIFTDRRRPPPTSRPAPRSSSSRPLRPAPTPPSWSASTTTRSTRPTHKVVSNASCTTNCFVPMIKVLDDAFGVEKGLMTTIHAYTGDQTLVDGPHSDLRRARAAAINIIPTSTGAARATGLVLESMKGKLDGTSLRVPVPTARSPTSPASSSRTSPSRRSTRRSRPRPPRARCRRCSSTPRTRSSARDIVGSPAVVHLRLPAHDGHGQPGQGAAAGTTTSGATPTAWSTSSDIVGAANK